MGKKEDDLKYRRTIKGLVSKIYSDQKYNSKVRGHNPPEYSKEELIIWLYKNGLEDLFEKWKESNFSKALKPSVDRISNNKNYNFDNIQLTTWSFNDAKGHEDRKNVEFNKYCKEVIQIDKITGEVIQEFESIREAFRITGINRRGISWCCSNRKKYKTAGGYKWKFKQ